MKSIALLWNRGMRPLSIIACLVLEHKGKSRSSALTGNSDWMRSWGDLGGVWHFALPFDEYLRKFWYPHLRWFQRSTDNCGKIHVRIILGHPICWTWLTWNGRTQQIPSFCTPLTYLLELVGGASILHGRRFPTPHIATQHQLYICQTNSQQTDRVVCLLPESANGPWGKKWVVYELPGQ